MEDEIKGIKIEELFCGVMSLETLLPCKGEAATLVQIEEHGAILCMCESHALEIFVDGVAHYVQESTPSESKRYFGIEIPRPVPEVG
jgi:hypothetical protein